MIEIINRQNLKKINRKDLTKKIRKALSLLKLSNCSMTLIVCDDAYIRKVNRKVFKLSNPTDVISLNLNNPIDPKFLGEIIVSLQQALSLGPKYGNGWEKEFLLYVIHGILHLIGYDDVTVSKRKKMFKKQDQIIEAIW